MHMTPGVGAPASSSALPPRVPMLATPPVAQYRLDTANAEATAAAALPGPRWRPASDDPGGRDPDAAGGTSAMTSKARHHPPHEQNLQGPATPIIVAPGLPPIGASVPRSESSGFLLGGRTCSTWGTGSGHRSTAAPAPTRPLPGRRRARRGAPGNLGRRIHSQVVVPGGMFGLPPV